MSMYHAKTVTIPDSTNTDIVRPSDFNSAHNQYLTLSGNTAGQSTVSGTNIVFSGANNVTVSGVQGAGAATIGFSAAGGGGAFSANGGSSTFNTLTFGDSNGVTFSNINGSLIATVKTDYLTTAMVSNAGSNFVAATAAFAGTNASGTIASSGISVSVHAPQTGISGAGAGTQTATSGTIAFANSNGISFGMSNSSQITASYTVPSTAGLISNINVSAGTTSNNLSAVVYSNSNNVSFGLNGSTVTASASYPAGASATGNFGALGAGTQTATSGTVTFANSNGISFGMSGSNQITASYTVPTQTVQSYNIMAAGTQTANTTGSVAFVNSNGISFGMSNSSQITASYTVPSTAGLLSAINLSAGTTSNNLSAFTFANSNGVSFGLNGSVVTASAAGGGGGAFSASGGSSTFNTLNFANSNNVTFSNSGGSVVASVAASGAGWGGAAGAAAVGIADSVSTVTTSNVVFSNSNNVSFGLNGNTMTASASYPAGASATGNFGALGAGTQTATSGTVAFSNSNGISFGMSGSNQITASYTVPSTAGLISNINVSAGTTSNNLSAITFSNANGVSFGLNGDTMTASHNGLTTAMVSNAGSNFVAATAAFAGTNASGTIASNGVSISVNAGGGAANTLNFWMPNAILNNTSFLVPGQNTIYMQHLHPEEPIGISNVEFNCLHSFVSSSNSQSVGMTIRYGLYEQGTGASSQSIQSVGTSSMFMQASYNSSTAAGFTCGQGGTSFTVTSNNSNLFGTALSGPKFLYLPFTTTLEANKEYFWAMLFSSTTAVNTGPMRFNMLVQTNINSTVWGELKMTTYAVSGTNQWEEYDGIQYSATSSNLPANVNSTQMQMMASKGRLLMIFENE